MDKAEAASLLEAELTTFRDQPYSELAIRVPDGDLQYAATSQRGVEYQIDIQFVWDAEPGGNIRVMASIDDGGWRAFVPLTRDFIKAPDGSFVGD